MANDTWQRTRHVTNGTEQRFNQMMQDSPMVLGAVAIAAGALMGTLLPRTDMEDTYLGEARDAVLDSAREMTEHKIQDVSSAAISSMS